MNDRVGVILLGFGEPEGADPVEVEVFLEKIFLANSRLEPHEATERGARARALAAARAPSLIHDYESIGGSPLMKQLREQAEALQAELARRGRPFPVAVGTQFCRPSIADAVEWAVEHEIGGIVALPTYPKCGPSTTLAAIDSLRTEVDARSGLESVVRITGWHRHRGFGELWAAAVQAHADASEIRLDDPGTLLYFSAHGTPVAYLEQVPYQRYVEEASAAVADALGIDDYVIGYQNHGNRPIPWVEPDNEVLLPSLSADRIVVVPISFLHEQSETLVELDQELSGIAASAGIGFHRVPVPYDDPALIEMWADLVEEAVGDPGSGVLRPCVCSSAGAWCTNGGEGGDRGS